MFTYKQKKRKIRFYIIMGKNFLLILFLLCVFTGNTFAYSTPRWFTMPVSVYIPKQKEAIPVTDAFKSWQTSTKSCVRFLVRNAEKLAPLCKINVIFVDNLPSGALYKVNPIYSQLGGCRNCGTRYYNNSDIIIALHDADGKKLTTEQLNAVALQAVGVAVGVDVNEDKNSIMYKDSDFSKNTLTREDIQAAFKVYKRVRK